MRVKPIIIQKKTDKESYVNTETGEMLSDEISSTIIEKKETNYFIMHYDEYVIIEANAIEYINRNFNDADCGKILKITNMTYGSYNALHIDESTPHNNSTLMIKLNLSRNKFHNLMKRLFDRNIINYMISNKSGQKCQYILLNPSLARKKKQLDKSILCYFDELK